MKANVSKSDEKKSWEKKDVKSEVFEMLLSLIFSSALKMHLNLFGCAKGRNSQNSPPSLLRLF